MRLRGCDSHGCGHYLAKRGSRTHTGQDLLTPAGAGVGAPVAGEVTKIGYPYADDLSFRYVQITNNGYDVRLFYVEPSVQVGQVVSQGEPIGTVQDLSKRYAGIPNHVHLEVKKDGCFIDPIALALSMVTA